MKNMTRIAACAVVSTLGVGPLATLAFGVLIMKRISVEEKALRQALGER